MICRSRCVEVNDDAPLQAHDRDERKQQNSQCQGRRHANKTSLLHLSTVHPRGVQEKAGRIFFDVRIFDVSPLPLKGRFANSGSEKSVMSAVASALGYGVPLLRRPSSLLLFFFFFSSSN